MSAAVVKMPNLPDRAVEPLPDHLRQWVNRLRFHAAGCRSAARLDLFRACALLSPVTEEAEAAGCSALIRVLGQALEKSPVFFKPGVDPLSFDEAWLVSIIDARLRGDLDSVAFLVLRRVAPEKRRAFMLLIDAVAELMGRDVI
ncbi:MAG: hypothetical protein AAGC92_00200 [Pseudomonadota bacterium]